MTAGLRSRRPVRAVGRVLTAVSGCLLWAVLTVTPSEAHDQLRSTAPADGAVLEQAPVQLEMTYTADILVIAPMAVLRDAAGNDIPTAAPVVEGKTLTVPWPAGVGGGDYDVVWRVVSSDGHPIQGTFGFTVQGAAVPATSDSVPTPSASAAATPNTETAPSLDAAPASTPTSEESRNGSSAPVIAGGAVLLVVGVAALLVVRHRRAARPTRP